MSPEDPAAIGRRLFQRMTPPERTVEALSAGLQAACRQLDAALSPIVGTLGVQMVLRRAMTKATERYPLLVGVTVHDDGIDVGSLLGLSSEGGYEQVRPAFEEVIAEFVVVLSQMLGVDLTARLLRVAFHQEDQG